MAKNNIDQLLEKSRIVIDPKASLPVGKKEPQYIKDDYISILSALGFEFRLNELNDKLEVNRRPITDVTAAEIRSKVRDLGLYRVEVIADHYLRHARENSYNPIKDYFKSLNWDKVDHIKKLASYFTDSDGIFELVLRKWLVGAIAKVFEQAQNPMMVLNSQEQGIGKSFFAQWVCPPDLREEYCTSSAILPDNKDHQIRICEKFIWEVSELEATTKRADLSALKAFITLEHSTFRKSYGHYEITKPTISSFIGTVNDTNGFLNDPSGNRRFRTVDLKSINQSYSTKVDIHQVWAQAFCLYNKGETNKLSDMEKARVEKINQRFEVEDPTIDMIKKHFKINKDRRDWDTPTIEIIKALRNDGWRGGKTETGDAMKIATAAKSLELEKVYSPTRGWRGITAK